VTKTARRTRKSRLSLFGRVPSSRLLKKSEVHGTSQNKLESNRAQVGIKARPIFLFQQPARDGVRRLNGGGRRCGWLCAVGQGDRNDNPSVRCGISKFGERLRRSSCSLTKASPFGGKARQSQRVSNFGATLSSTVRSVMQPCYRGAGVGLLAFMHRFPPCGGQRGRTP
jgi:hypothetical protein